MPLSLSANLHRRHLSEGQRAVVALKVRKLLQPAAKERQGERNDLKPKSQDITADRRSSSPVAEAAAQQAAASVLAENVAKIATSQPKPLKL